MEPTSISKVDSRLARTSYGWAALVMGLPFMAIGGYFALAGFGYLPLLGKANVPLWVIGAVGISFALGGLMLVGHSVRGLLDRRRRAALEGRYPGQPWMLDYSWNPAGVQDEPAARWANALLGTLLMGALLIPFNWWAYFSGDDSPFVQVFVGLFDLVLVAIALSFVYRLLQFLKYGYSQLSFAHFPFAPGDELELRLSPNRCRRLEVTLRFVEEWMERSGSGRNRHVSQKAVVHHSETRNVETRPTDTEVAIRFDLPDDKAWVTQLTANPRVRYWELAVQANEPGIDFRTTFPLPVYDCPRSQQIALPARRIQGARQLLATPYAFELGLPLIVGALLGAAWLAAPEAVQRARSATAALVGRVSLSQELRPLPGIYPDAMDVAVGPDGAVWLLSKYDLTRYGPDGPTKLLDSALYRATFPHRMGALSALTVTGSDEAWVGSWYGELLHYRGSEWHELSTRGEPLKGRIHVLVAVGEMLYIGGRDGLWRWTPAEGLRKVEAVPPGGVWDVVADGLGGLGAAIGRQLWRMSSAEWTQFWAAETEDREITALAALADGGWLAGTHNGLVSINVYGRETQRELAGLQVTSIDRGQAALWVGTWKAGVQIRDGEHWQSLDESRGLPGNDISALTVDSRGRLWIAVYGKGVSRVTVERLRERLGGPLERYN